MAAGVLRVVDVGVSIASPDFAKYAAQVAGRANNSSSSRSMTRSGRTLSMHL